LYDRYVVRLVRFLERAGASPEAAWDATQETFARLLERGDRDGLALDETAWPWLASSARNLLRDEQRRGKVDDKARRKLGVMSVPFASDELEDALMRLDSKTRGDELEIALRSLPADQQSAITGRVIGEIEYEQLATVSCTSGQTIRRRVSRGLRTMRMRLEGGKS
jgi:RNA polymerase sigma factor (sigma-70 family)